MKQHSILFMLMAALIIVCIYIIFGLALCTLGGDAADVPLKLPVREAPLAAGLQDYYAIRVDGSLILWGSLEHGEVEEIPFAQAAKLLDHAVGVYTSGESETLAWDSDGTLWSINSNRFQYLISYLQAYDPHELKRCGPREYCTRTHDSLKISNGKWCWNSRGIGGRTALDYLIKVQGMDFVGAVETLCGYRAPPPHERPAPKPPKPFKLPEASRFPSMMLAYLQDRGIHPDLIGACIQNGTLYESRRYQNCVFVGKDMSGHARFACLRGTRDHFRLDVEGSDKRYNFSVLAADPKCLRLAVAESPIDALSLATLVKLSGGEWRDSHYLSLGGTAPRAMLQFLHDHPHVTQVSLCLDNDKAGIVGMERLEQAIRDDPELSQRVKLIYHNPPSAEHGKDYNEFLCAQVKAVKVQRHSDIAR